MKNKILKEKINSLSLNENGETKKIGENTLNRTQKRRLLKRYGLNPSDSNKYFKKSAKVVLDLLPDDTKVKLNYDRIMNSAGEKSQSYINFVEENKDKELTAYQDDKHKGTSLYCFREDTTEEDSKWLFDISDLIYDENAILNELLAEDGVILDENDNVVDIVQPGSDVNHNASNDFNESNTVNDSNEPIEVKFEEITE